MVPKKTHLLNKNLIRGRFSKFRKEKIYSQSECDIHQPELAKMSIGEPQLEHASLPIYGADFYQLKKSLSSNQRGTLRNEWGITEVVQTYTPAILSPTVCDTTTPPDSIPSLTLQELTSDDSEIYSKPYEYDSNESTSDLGKIDFLQSIPQSQSFYHSIHTAMAERGLIPTSQDKYLESINQNNSSSNSTLDQIQSMFDDRYSNLHCNNEGHEEFYSAEESTSALTDDTYGQISHDSTSTKSEEIVRVFNLDEKWAFNSTYERDCSSGDQSPVLDLEPCAPMRAWNSNHKQPSEKIQNESISDEDFVFDDSKRTGHKLSAERPNFFDVNSIIVPQVDIAQVESHRNAKSPTLPRPNKAISNPSIIPKDHSILNGTSNSANFDDVVAPSRKIRPQSHRNNHLNRINKKIEYLEAREKSDWSNIITGLPRFIPINHHERR